MEVQTEKSYFDGGLLQLIGWRILGGLVTALTLGICYPWARYRDAAFRQLDQVAFADHHYPRYLRFLAEH